MTVLASSAFLASAAVTLRIQNDILPVRLHIQMDSSKVRCMEEADSKRCSDRGQARKAEGVGRLSRQEDHERTSRQRSGSSAFAGSCSATFWRLWEEKWKGGPSGVYHVATVLQGSVGTTWSTTSFGEPYRGPKFQQQRNHQVYNEVTISVQTVSRLYRRCKVNVLHGM